MRRSAPLIAFVGGAAILGVALLVFLASGSEGKEEWTTYYNGRFDYAFDHPPGWEVSTRDPAQAETMQIQMAQVTNGKDSVIVAVNLPMPACEGSARRDQAEVVVKEVKGQQFDCYNGQQPSQIVRDFQGPESRRYMVMGQPASEQKTVRRIVESFRFLD